MSELEKLLRGSFIVSASDEGGGYLGDMSATAALSELAAQASEIASLRGERDALLAELIARNAVVGQLQVAIEDKASETAALREALAMARGAIEGWIGSGYLVPGNMRDALSSIDAALKGSPTPDHTEAMRVEIAALREELEAYRDAVRVDCQMDGPKFMGCNVSQLRRAWNLTRAALKSNGGGK
jgi:hypothetical protein